MSSKIMGSMTYGDAPGGVTWKEFCMLNSQDNIRREYHDGYVIRMDHLTEWHQDIVTEVTISFGSFLKDKPCKFWPGRDVHLKISSRDVLYMPDGLVLCDRTKDTGTKIEGAPDFILEVWSKSNSFAERRRKISDYKAAGVREIWEIIGEPGSIICIKHVQQDDNKYITSILYGDKLIPSTIFVGCEVDLTRI